MWEVLPHTHEDCVKVASRKIITKNIILRTVYESRRRIILTIFEVTLQRYR